jgi:hypothetical protein
MANTMKKLRLKNDFLPRKLKNLDTIIVTAQVFRLKAEVYKTSLKARRHESIHPQR